MTDEEIIEQQNAYYMAGYPSRRSEKKMTKDEKTCYNCGNKNCSVYYSTVKKDYKRHFETYEYKDFNCVNHDKWEELKMEEIRTDNTKTLKNALERIAELEKENVDLKERLLKVENAYKKEV